MSESLVPHARRKLTGANLIGDCRHSHVRFAFPCNGHLRRVQADTFPLLGIACITTLIKHVASAVSTQMTFGRRLSKVVQVFGKCTRLSFVNERLQWPEPALEFLPIGHPQSNSEVQRNV